MIYVRPIAYESFRSDLFELEKTHKTVWDEIVRTSAASACTETPFVQLSYDEITINEQDLVFGYSGIIKANTPIGLPCEFDPFEWQSNSIAEVRFFPLSGFHAHLRAVTSEMVRDYEGCESMDAYVEIKGDYMTATEYLVGGTLECIQFCKRNHFALSITW